ncbi:jg23735 [Pararge aegeria aegeria]|uniref:Jg23735 protein n=1 Tax=Pararge aegeria aegeria TaxID=348720 RepID=A0A8S4RFJ6_9NEOP|nr:jg23735 [Pararge aegeria aegeria]
MTADDNTVAINPCLFQRVSYVATKMIKQLPIAAAFSVQLLPSTAITKPSAQRGDHRQTLILGEVEGTRARGRSPMRWTDQIKSSVGGPLHECTRLSANREKWRMIVRRVTTATNNVPP